MKTISQDCSDAELSAAVKRLLKKLSAQAAEYRAAWSCDVTDDYLRKAQAVDAKIEKLRKSLRRLLRAHGITLADGASERGTTG